MAEGTTAGGRLVVALVSPHFRPHIGGVEVHVEKLAQHMAARGHQVDVLTHGFGDAPMVEDADGYTVRRFGSLTSSQAYPWSPALGHHLRTARYDVVHAHNYHGVPFLQAGRCPSPYLVVTPHYHGGGHTGMARTAHRLWRPLCRSTWRRADAVIAVSEAERALITRHVPEVDGRIRVIGNGVDTPPAGRTGPPLIPAPYVLVVARLEPYKQIGVVLEALAACRHPELHLLVVGKGPEFSALRSRAGELGVAPRVWFRSDLDGTEMASAYREATCYVTMSRREAFGLTLAEAMAAGVHVIASDIPAHQDVLRLGGREPTGLLPLDATGDRVAEEIDRLLAEPPPPRAAYASWASVTRAVLAVYDEVRGRRRAQGSASGRSVPDRPVPDRPVSDRPVPDRSASETAPGVSG